MYIYYLHKEQTTLCSKLCFIESHVFYIHFISLCDNILRGETDLPLEKAIEIKKVDDVKIRICLYLDGQTGISAQPVGEMMMLI